VDERVLSEASDLVLHEQLLSFQFRNYQIVRGWVRQGFADFLLKGLVPSFEFRKMRLDRHVAYLLA
jgi:hypothetical protein